MRGFASYFRAAVLDQEEFRPGSKNPLNPLRQDMLIAFSLIQELFVSFKKGNSEQLSFLYVCQSHSLAGGHVYLTALWKFHAVVTSSWAWDQDKFIDWLSLVCVILLGAAASKHPGQMVASLW